ncbi:hypothetical protein LR48_Vigan08g059800 [Vigna angularis]|uniref:Bet v I/Major latex protein domain-containing protein n=2 Tax=Phaseolus angularis TaxID=3914 RepID=A0A0L9V449_PHAAN|nr:MLP-like protein 28 [Vigna angularis]KAG2396847.1 uncharacterized protein HKW66_Vig0231220 [Vigna angularis]KOM49771.1 hypothetical protein LR48_Vigan08g059800 [Vigna angularis]BAT89693.1 hypothetical protein VIGAN_06071800 [Vigna angularis var. angularis]
MTLFGKISTEIGVHATAEKWFKLLATQLHHVQNLADRVHGTKLHHGEDWHHNESIKQWTYVIDGKVSTCHESIESVDEANKTISFKVFGEEIEQKFKVFKVIFQAIDKENGGAIVKWTIEYERVSEEVDPPYSYIEFQHKCTADIDVHLLKA